ncbi:MAG: hypothetical protein GF331_13885 [Chitinivibrionales bacterium]|nr:hypothetical protein [Chitinivibrionales bacterium]
MHERHEEIRDTITEFIHSHFVRARADAFTSQTNLLEEGIVDSMGLLDIIGFLENAFAVRVTEDDLLTDNFGTIDSLVAYVERKLGRRQVANDGSEEIGTQTVRKRAASSG